MESLKKKPLKSLNSKSLCGSIIISSSQIYHKDKLQITIPTTFNHYELKKTANCIKIKNKILIKIHQISLLCKLNYTLKGCGQQMILIITLL